MGNKNNNINDKSPAKNNNCISEYELIFHFPINQGDCINSLDIFDDKVAIGTIMGNAYLLRVDKNNLEVNNNYNDIYLNNNSYSENNIYTSNRNSTIRTKKSLIKLNKIENEEKNLNNYANIKINRREKEMKSIDKTNDISKIKQGTKKIKMIRLNNKLDESSNQNSNFTATKKRSIKIKNIKIKNEEKKEIFNNMQDITNIDDEDEKKYENNTEDNNNKSYKKEKITESNNGIKDNLRENEKIKKFPQISRLIEEANENICCIQFDTEEILNISVGDFEIFRIKDIHRFNMNDPYSRLNYAKIQNYKYSNKHFKHCENTICMMTATNYLIIFANYVGFSSDIVQEKYKYNNINLVEENKTSGKIQMFNYSIPFDFDGEDFLFLEYISMEERNICLFDTINNKYFYQYKIGKNFGHISHMKILLCKNKKIFLCRNDSQCEIHLLDEDFTCEEVFEHIGNEIINIFIYFKESKLSDDFILKINDEKNKKNLNLNNNYEDYIKINNNKSKSFIKIDSENSNSKRGKNNQKITLEKNKDINHNNILSINNSVSNKNKQEKNIKDIKIEVREESDNSSIKDMNSNSKDINIKNNTILIFNKNKSHEESKVPLDEDIILEKNNKNKLRKGIQNIKTEDEKQNTIDVDDKVEKINYYIFILDNNGDLNMYKNKQNRTLFNLYNIEGIDESYKEKKFFSVGYPYYFVVNEFFFAITTDFGLFVISNKNKEL